MLRLITFILVSIFIGHEYIIGVNTHGMMLDPPGRGSVWREDPTMPANYDDNGLYCGGYAVQWSAYEGKCGICGDSFADATPRPHELGGMYGLGKIVRKYKAGQQVTVAVKITQNHLGKFNFDLCNLDSQQESEKCYRSTPLKFATGKFEHYLNSPNSGFYNVTVQLPLNFKCNKCGLRWMYIAGNSWGVCEDGTGAVGCGPQEEFRNCADIAIL